MVERFPDRPAVSLQAQNQLPDAEQTGPTPRDIQAGRQSLRRFGQDPGPCREDLLDHVQQDGLEGVQMEGRGRRRQDRAIRRNRSWIGEDVRTISVLPHHGDGVRSQAISSIARATR